MRRHRALLSFAIASFAPFFAASQASSSLPNTRADSATKKLLADCDRLVEQGKYRAAFDALAPAGGDVEAVVAERIELCARYGGRGPSRVDFPFDPAAAAAAYYASRPISALIEKSLGDYYFAAVERFGRGSGSGEAAPGGEAAESAADSATASATAAASAAACYESAFGLGFEDATTLANCAECRLLLGAYDKAAALYDRAFELGLDSADARYAAGFACLRSGYASKALDQARKALELLAGDPGRRLDALLLAADASGAKGDLAGGLGYLDAAWEIDSGDYRVYDRRIRFRLAGKDAADALADAQSLLGLAPRSPGAVQLVMEAFEGSGRKDLLPGFFDRALAAYADDPEAQGNILFHYSLVAHGARDDARARSLVARAEEAFKLSGTKDREVFDAIATLREAYGE
jgi:tetratricopeptide (TPR) repeat protein